MIVKQPNLSRTEVQRLNALVNLVHTYQDLLADYIDYWGIERKLLEMETKYARLVERETIKEIKKTGMKIIKYDRRYCEGN